jgi:hypothetical protein
LFLAGGRLAVYHWAGGELLEPLWFSADEGGLSEFSLYLAHAPHDPVYMLVDVVEEEFREESIPHVLGGDRRALIRTRVNRLFRNPTYSHAVVQGRDAGGRRDDQLLLAALIRPDLLSPWIGQIAKHKIPLAGIYSLPFVSEALIKHMPVDSEHALLVTQQSTGGLRQTFFNNKRIKVSRLAIMPPGGAPGRASYVLGEIEKIRRYLNSLRQLPHDSPLDVYVVGDSSLLADITQQSPDSLTTRHHLFELDEVAEMAGMKIPYGSEYADRIFAHLLAKKRMPNQYAPASQMRHSTMHNTRLWLIAASVLLVVASLFVSGAKVVDSVVASGETGSANEQTAFYDERYDIARKRMPKIPAEPKDIKSAVEMADKLRAYKMTPRAMVVTLSEGLARFPELTLDNIRWRASSDRDKLIGNRGGSADARQGRGSAGGDPSDANLYQLARVRGRVEPFSGDYRAALGMVRGFAAALLGMSQVEAVQVLELPLDVTSNAALSGDTKGALNVAPFELRIVIRDKINESS